MRRLLVALTLCCSLVLPSWAQAQPLTGEVFSSLEQATITSGSCNPEGTSTFTFSVSGIAVGAYPGTFTETGTVTVGPQTVEILPGQFAGPVTDFQASFQIDSPLGTVTGTKKRVGDPGPTAPFNAGVCLTGGFPQTVAQIYANAVRYTASTPDGPDQGDAVVQGNYSSDPGTNIQPEWREFFFPSPPEPGVGPPATLTLSPATATNTVGQQHCVTATVKDAAGSPVAGVDVVFSVSGANSAGPTTKTTNADGQATFCYTGTKAGEDAIRAFADTNANGTQDAGEPAGAATKTYVAAAPATLTLSPAAATNTVGQQHCVTATVKDAFGNPVSGATVRFSVSGANSAGPTAKTTDANGQATFCYTGTKAGEDAVRAYADTNTNGTQDAGEPTGAATKMYVAAGPATLTLSPPTATNTVGTQHCVTATVKDAFGNPVSGATVRFSVAGSVTTSGTRTTGSGGTAQFCYQGPELPGADAIKAYADTNSNGTQNAGEPAATATKTWVVPASTPLCTVAITNGGWIRANNRDKATFGGNVKVSSAGVPSGSEEYQDHGPAANINVHSTKILAVVCASKRASIYGVATINGSGSYLFKIDVSDVAEPGVNKDTYRITLSNGYDSGEHPLGGGNIQIRNG